ncbi:MAG: DUF4168 domain-containing protein [Cyanobacteriota bacterium]|nr:DUF4168 domain-containing protein [Cyanobacteriota bacterium]
MLTMLPWRSNFNKILLVASLTAGSVLSGIVPTVSGTSHLSFQTAARAQSAQEVVNFARAVLAMEPLRQAAYDDIKRIIGSARVPNINCSQPSSFSSLPGNARQIAVNYCNKSREFVRSNGLTIDRFNEIANQAQSNPELKRRIQNAMIELQR